MRIRFFWIFCGSCTSTKVWKVLMGSWTMRIFSASPMERNLNALNPAIDLFMQFRIDKHRTAKDRRNYGQWYAPAAYAGSAPGYFANSGPGVYGSSCPCATDTYGYGGDGYGYSYRGGGLFGGSGLLGAGLFGIL